MLSWQAMILNGFFRFTMKRHGKKPINLERLRAMTKNPPRSALAVPTGYVIESVRSEQGLEFDAIWEGIYNEMENGKIYLVTEKELDTHQQQFCEDDGFRCALPILRPTVTITVVPHPQSSS